MDFEKSKARNDCAGETSNNLTEQPIDRLSRRGRRRRPHCCKFLLSNAESGCEIGVSQRGQKPPKTVAEDLWKLKPLPVKCNQES
jgi:hypothetical protein